MKFLTASKLLVLPFLASVNAVQAVEEDAAAKVKGSFLKDHRALHQQKLNEFKPRKLQGYSEETQKLLNCYEPSRSKTLSERECNPGVWVPPFAREHFVVNILP